MSENLSQGRAVEFIVACIMSCHRLTNKFIANISQSQGYSCFGNYTSHYYALVLGICMSRCISHLTTICWLVKNILNLIHYYQRQEGIITAICFVYAIIGSEMLCFRFR